jgi:hypothetical protein
MLLLNRVAVELVGLDSRALVDFQIFLKIYLVPLVKVGNAKVEAMTYVTISQST